jgi:hypothetical protein
VGSASVFNALPAAKALTTTRHIIASQTVLIIFESPHIADDVRVFDSGWKLGKIAVYAENGQMLAPSFSDW